MKFLEFHMLRWVLLSLLLASMLSINCTSQKPMNNVKLTKVREMPLTVSPQSLLGYLVDMTTDPEGQMYLADGSDGKVKIFDTNGRYLRNIGLSRPLAMTGITMDERGNLYVNDLATSSVFKFSATGTKTDSIPVDSGSLFVLGIPRIYKDRLYLGVFEKQYSAYDFYKSTQIGIYDLTSKKLERRFGYFDELYGKLSPLSPEVHFDIGEDGTVCVVQSHFSGFMLFDSDGNLRKTVTGAGSGFRIPSKPCPKDLKEYREWIPTWSYMSTVRCTKDYIFTQYFDRRKGSTDRFEEEFYLNINKRSGEALTADFHLPGRFLHAAGHFIFVCTEPTSTQKIISVYRIDYGAPE